MKYLSIISIAVLTLLSACQKDPSTSPNDTTTPQGPTTAKRLVRIDYVGLNSYPQTYAYDSQGRIVKADDGEDVATFQYNGNEVTISEWRKEEAREVFKFKGKLNAAGNLEDGTATSNYSKSFVYQQKHNYEYNADGFLSKATMTRDNGEKYEYQYFYNKGNLIRQDNYRNGVLDYAFHYEYGSGNPNKMGFNVYAFVPGNNFLGKKATEMPVKYTLKRPGVADQVSTYTYTVDAAGYVTSQKVYDAQGRTFEVLYRFE